MIRRYLAVFSLACGAMVQAAHAQVGTVVFQTSCAASAQAAFDRGLALLHSFQYDESEAAFTAATTADAHCAIAWWGRAMTQYHQLWDWPSDDALAKGREALAHARGESAAAHERAYIDAAAEFFAGEGARTHADRMNAYSDRLRALHATAPDDVEATAFYALSRIALAEESIDTIANLTMAIDLLDPAFRAHPHHPGLAHYLIHAADRPELAARGLEAARAYSDIAPDSSHALHMPTHIFSQLGLWRESIPLNVRAAEVGARAAREGRGGANYQVHAIDYLAWAYLQAGQEARARAVIGEIATAPAADALMKVNMTVFLTARSLIDLHRWTEAASLGVPDIPAGFNVEVYQARAIGSARIGVAAAARADLEQLRASIEARRANDRLRGYAVSDEAAPEVGEAESWILFAERQVDDALRLLMETARAEDAKGGGGSGPLAREMVGDMLLELRRPREALEAYRAALVNNANRFNSVYGAFIAASALGERQLAATYRDQLLGMVMPDADRPEVKRVRGELTPR